MRTTDTVVRGQQAYARRAWRDAYEELAAADAHALLGAEDLNRLGTAAYLIGEDEAAVDGMARAHREFLAHGDSGRAVRCAFWLGVILHHRGRHAEGSGWLSRGQRVLDESGEDCVERGYLLAPAALQALDGGDPETAYAGFGEVLAIADRFADPDLMALSRLSRGHALVLLGEARRGLALLDEAMLAVTMGDISPIAAGIMYCEMIIACRQIFDLRRAQEWTAALSRWCADQQELKPYRGQCLIHRSEIMQLRGEWSDALAEVTDACTHLAELPGEPVLGMALYQQGELLRLRGAFGRAEQAYRKSSEWGHPVHPGLALLRLAQGRLDDAVAAIRRVTDEAEGDRVKRSRVLAAFVEIMLAAGDTGAARTAAADLDTLALDFDAPYLRAVAASARGAVLLAEGDASAACDALRRAWTTWLQLDAPYEAARVRLLMSQACERMADHDTAAMERDAARRVFEQLGAVPALAEVAKLSRTSHDEPGGLTARELDVLRLVATGVTNREIADALVISEKTVARHMNNIFTKLGVSSRAAATAYAYEHGLA
ncbi:LuxR C-terminal-related transcriptional regulator [Haloechinothrix halophila]|uniref:LuxR C-terminal-related transcriptional regulator n=1 Tax=Haloechinothrix halophila TaxID=1069073 RepID=UPI0004007B03